MPVIKIQTRIEASLEICFDLARSIDFHIHSMSASGEIAIAGVQTGLIGMGQEVTWRARHLGITQTLSSRITAFDRPNHFRDSMVKGAFKRFDHDHIFRRAGSQTLMEDVFMFESPFGILGRLVNSVLLNKCLARILTIRGREIKIVAESEEWKKYLDFRCGENTGSGKGIDR